MEEGRSECLAAQTQLWQTALGLGTFAGPTSVGNCLAEAGNARTKNEASYTVASTWFSTRDELRCETIRCKSAFKRAARMSQLFALATASPKEGLPLPRPLTAALKADSQSSGVFATAIASPNSRTARKFDATTGRPAARYSSILRGYPARVHSRVR